MYLSNTTVNKSLRQHRKGLSEVICYCWLSKKKKNQTFLLCILKGSVSHLQNGVKNVTDSHKDRHKAEKRRAKKKVSLNNMLWCGMIAFNGLRNKIVPMDHANFMDLLHNMMLVIVNFALDLIQSPRNVSWCSLQLMWWKC